MTLQTPDVQQDEAVLATTVEDDAILLLLVAKDDAFDAAYVMGENHAQKTQPIRSTIIGDIAGSELQLPDDASMATHAVVSLPRNADVNSIVRQLKALNLSRICFLTDISIHFGDPVRGSQETLIREAFSQEETVVKILRHGIFQPSLARWNGFAWASPLLADSPRTTVVSSVDLRKPLYQLLFAEPESTQDTITLLGPNRSWKSLLDGMGETSLFYGLLETAAWAASWLGLGIVLRTILRWRNRLPHRQMFNFNEIRPTSETELLSLCNQHNRPHVAICGYNNGVNHFGWKHDGKTIVPTVESGDTIKVDGNSVTVDAGVTLKQAITALRVEDREFYVVPNYSYIAMGTVFFVPVHGSGSEVSTLGDTIEWVRLYDPETNTIIEANREDELFRDSMYNMQSPLVLLQLRLRVRSVASYFVEQTEHSNSTAEEVWKMFTDPETSNIEIRKNKAASDTLQLSKYYTSDGGSDGRLAVPRDSLGRLWDRLEENRVSAWLFHTLVRKLAFHVELFLREDEFAIFWEHHKRLPVSKIQLRFVRHDGMKHSPFSDVDCVSADLFMTKGKRDEFLTFVREFIPNVRVNPGKQSM